MADSFVTPWTVAHQAPLVNGISQTRILEWVVISFSIKEDSVCILSIFVLICVRNERTCKSGKSYGDQNSSNGELRVQVDWQNCRGIRSLIMSSGCSRPLLQVWRP